MAVERVIGIDFGTSTSLVKIKAYRDGQPCDAMELADYVRFDNKDSVPTLVYEANDGRFLIGYEAETAAVKGTLHQNFKIDLINPDIAVREQAHHFCEIFLGYLYEAYNEQKGYFTSCDTESTYISYPAKWPDSVRETMIALVQKAGFKNVCGLDEPTAAIHTVMVQENKRLRLNENGAANILMIDMGAGTTDLVLCRYAPHEKKPISILNVWPKASSKCLMGGREIDEVLCEYVKAYLINQGIPNTKNFNEKYLDKCKAWKENNVSPVFRDKNGVVRFCGFIDTLTAMLNIDIEFPPLSRDAFEDMFRDYLAQFPRMINDCLDDADFPHDELDYVILTGGHSQWYFPNEILEGSLSRFGIPDLPKIKADASRILKLSRPQETVALGLVYQRIAAVPAAQQSADTAFCCFCGGAMPSDSKFCPYCGKDTADTSNVLNAQEHVSYTQPTVAASTASSYGAVNASAGVHTLSLGKSIEVLRVQLTICFATKRKWKRRSSALRAAE